MDGPYSVRPLFCCCGQVGESELDSKTKWSKMRRLLVGFLSSWLHYVSFGFWNFYLGDTNLVFYDQSQKFKGYNLDYKHMGLQNLGIKLLTKVISKRTSSFCYRQSCKSKRSYVKVKNIKHENEKKINVFLLKFSNYFYFYSKNWQFGLII